MKQKNIKETNIFYDEDYDGRSFGHIPETNFFDDQHLQRNDAFKDDVKQSYILSSEEDTDSPSQPIMDSHENTPFDDEEDLTEELETPKNGISEEFQKDINLSNGSAPSGKEDKDKTPTRKSSSPSTQAGNTNPSNILAGKWWFGKDTRYVVHCDKKHSKNQKTENSEFVIQKNREISKLKTELKSSKTELEEKEKYIREFRDKVRDLENLIEKNKNLQEYSKLMKRQKEIQDEFKKEKKDLIEKHDLRVRQLVQEALDARSEALKKTEQLENFTKLKKQNLVDAEMNTDPIQVCRF